MEVLLNVLQGIVMLGVRQHGELQLAMDTVENIKEAMMDPWVVEVCQPMTFLWEYWLNFA